MILDFDNVFYATVAAMCFNMYLLPIFGDDWQLGFWWKKMQIGFENVCQNKQIPSMLLCSASCSMTFRNDPFAWGVAKAQNSRCYLTTVLKSCLNCLRNLWIRPNNNIRKEGGGGLEGGSIYISIYGGGCIHDFLFLYYFTLD